MSNDLFGVSAEASLPANTRLTDFDDLVGHKVQAVYHGPLGRYQVDLVIVTETGCWLVAKCDANDGEDSPSISVLGAHGWCKSALLSDFVSASELLRGGCINRGEYELLKKQEHEREAEQKAVRAARLRAELERLEGKKS